MEHESTLTQFPWLITAEFGRKGEADLGGVLGPVCARRVDGRGQSVLLRGSWPKGGPCLFSYLVQYSYLPDLLASSHPVAMSATDCSDTCLYEQVDAIKRSCIKTLPHTLVIHLKRFEFDYETMTRWKIKDRCVCPSVAAFMHVILPLLQLFQPVIERPSTQLHQGTSMPVQPRGGTLATWGWSCPGMHQLFMGGTQAPPLCTV